MLDRFSLIGIVFSILIIILDFFLLEKHKIHGRGFVLWLIIGILLGLFTGIPPLLIVFYAIFGTEFTPWIIVSASFLFFLLAIFYLYYRISEIHSLLMKLAMEVSAREYVSKKNTRKKNEVFDENESWRRSK